MSEQDGRQAPTLQRPTSKEPEAWNAYWKAQGQPWRTESEIDLERQQFLVDRRIIKPNIERYIYPFKDIKLSRADVEWLLATHENGHGPVNSNDESQREREGLDLRGADLRCVDLRELPLANTRGGLNRSEHMQTTFEQRDMAKVHLERANLSSAHLEGATLILAHLEGANLNETHLEGADLYRTHLEGANLYGTYLGGASLRNTFFDTTTIFQYAILEHEKLGGVRLSDVHWGDMNISLVNWAHIKMIGDEYEAKQSLRWDGEAKNEEFRLRDYRRALRANRQLAVVLRDQGLNEEADNFAYRAQLLQRVVWRLQRRPLKFILSWFLYLLAGYGYRPVRSVAWYVTIIFGFALAYFAFGHIPPLEAFVFSLTSFHGRGFFPGNNIPLSDPRVVFAAFEAVVGLLIEISFIATFTQRFFGK